MNGEYKTVFEVSYLNNASLLVGIVFLSVGVLSVAIAIAKKMSIQAIGSRKSFFYFFCALWIMGGAALLYLSILDSHEIITALREGQCEIVEGVVEVLHEQASSGHDSGDRIRITNEEFVFSDYTIVLGYHRTISHGGSLTNGASARLHYRRNTILKVEIKK